MVQRPGASHGRPIDMLGDRRCSVGNRPEPLVGATAGVPIPAHLLRPVPGLRLT